MIRYIYINTYMTRLQLHAILLRTPLPSLLPPLLHFQYHISQSPSDPTQIGSYLAHFAYLANTKRAKTKAISLSSSLGRISSLDNAARWESPKSQSQLLPTFPSPLPPTHCRLTRFVIFNKNIVYHRIASSTSSSLFVVDGQFREASRFVFANDVAHFPGRTEDGEGGGVIISYLVQTITLTNCSLGSARRRSRLT